MQHVSHTCGSQLVDWIKEQKQNRIYQVWKRKTAGTLRSSESSWQIWGVNWSAGSYQRGHCGHSILEWSIRGFKENSSVIDGFSRTFEFSCGMRVLNKLSLSLHLPSASPPQLDQVCTLPSLEFLTEQSYDSLAPHGVNPEGPSGHLWRGRFTYKLWSPSCVSCRAGNRLSWRGDKETVLKPPLST